MNATIDALHLLVPLVAILLVAAAVLVLSDFIDQGGEPDIDAGEGVSPNNHKENHLCD